MGMSDPVSTPQSTSAHHITEDICDIKTVFRHTGETFWGRYQIVLSFM